MYDIINSDIVNSTPSANIVWRRNTTAYVISYEQDVVSKYAWIITISCAFVTYNLLVYWHCDLIWISLVDCI